MKILIKIHSSLKSCWQLLWALAFKINRRHLIKFNLIRETEAAEAAAAAAAGAEKQSNKEESEGNRKGESKSNCKAPWRNQSVATEASNTHTRRDTHTQTQTQ